MSVRILLAAAVLQMVGSPAWPMAHNEAASPFVKGRFADLSGNFKASAAYFKEAIEAAPEQEFVHQSAFYPLLLSGDFESAMKSAQLVGDRTIFMQLALDLDRFAKGRLDIRFGSDIEGPGRELRRVADAWIDLARGESAKALERLSTAEGTTPTHLMFNEALLMAMAGDFRAAAARLDPVTDMALPSMAKLTARFMRAQILLQISERRDEGLRELEALAALDSGPFAALAGERLDDVASEPTIMFDYVTSPQEGLSRYFALLTMSRNTGLTPRDELFFLRLAQLLDRENKLLRMWTAQALRFNDSYELAGDEYAHIEAEHVLRPLADIEVANTLHESGAVEEAIDFAREIARQHAAWPRAHRTLGRLLRSEKRYEEAIEAFDAAISLQRDTGDVSWQILYDRATTLQASEGVERSYDDFREAIEASNGNPYVLNYLGYSLADEGLRLDEAESLIKQALEKSPDNGAIIDSLGWVYYRQGRFPAAVQVLEQALRLEPTDPIVVDHLGDAYWAMGREREARFQWRRALSLEPDDTVEARIERKLEVGLDQVLAEESSEGSGETY